MAIISTNPQRFIENKENLLSEEWSLGNGQCPKCYGVPESWLGHPLHLVPSTLGHQVDCVLAESMNEFGLTPLYIGESTLTACYEHYTSNEGFGGTREIKNGCKNSHI